MGLLSLLVIAGVAEAVTPSACQVAGFSEWTRQVVPGINLVIAMGRMEGSRIGAGIDLAYITQHYSVCSAVAADSVVDWGEEHVAPSHGPVLHVWRVGGDWFSSLGYRVGLTHPLRVGTDHLGGYVPGPGALVELAGLVATTGDVGLDGQFIVEGPYVHARLGRTWAPGGWLPARMHVGAFYVPRPIDFASSVRDRP